jgi:uncharacterized protein YceH (UPF0502 family)
MSLSENDWQNTVDELVQMNQLMIDQKASSRVNKYFHRFCNTEFGNLQFSAQQRAIICVLFLRGPQTPGELRTRTTRLADFADVNEVESALNQLQNLNNHALVKKLEREPGKRECRYVHLFCEIDESSASEPYIPQVACEANSATQGIPLGDNNQLVQRVTVLEQQVVELTEQVASLMELLEDK